VRWLLDNPGPPRWRPYYSPVEIDTLCEQHIVAFLQARYGAVTYPISTNDLTILIEQNADDLNLYADLSIFDGAIDGLTLFYAEARPRVRIAGALSLSSKTELRLRSVLSHELGHVLLHSSISVLSRPTTTQCFTVDTDGPALDYLTPAMDWIEWQARHACGALLMPASAVGAAVQEFRRGDASHGGVATDAPAAWHLVAELQRRFQVSPTAARDRLIQLSYLTSSETLAAASGADSSRMREIDRQ
jgi:hypothetical protein